LLIALATDEGMAGRILSWQGANLDDVRRIVLHKLSTSKKVRKTGKIQLDESIQRVLEGAAEVARQRKSDEIKPAHLLFALEKNPSSRLETVMDVSGLDRDRILEELEDQLTLSLAQSELPALLETLEFCSRLFPEDVAVQNQLDRIAEILREYFGED
jgi:ATP-dependent Clp protease ATP-binding subunit ClpA